MTTETTSTEAPEMTIDEACRLMTTWRTWAEAVADLQAHGATYAPTLRDDDAAAPEPRHKQAIALLRAAIDGAGFRWCDGSNLHEPARRAEGKCSVVWCALGDAHEGEHDFKVRRRAARAA